MSVGGLQDFDELLIQALGNSQNTASDPEWRLLQQINKIESSYIFVFYEVKYHD